MKLAHCPIVRYGWRDALQAVKDGHEIFTYPDGHAEIMNNRPDDDTGVIGYLTKRSVQLLTLAQAVDKLPK